MNNTSDYMKRLAILILLFLMSPLAIPLFAQSEYRVGEVFDGKVIPMEQTKEILITRASELPGDIDHFHSIEFLADADMLATVTALVEADAANAGDKETSIKGGKLTYAILRFQNKIFDRYICFSAKPEEDDKYKVTILYIKGPESIKDLKKIFRNY